MSDAAVGVDKEEKLVIGVIEGKESLLISTDIAAGCAERPPWEVTDVVIYHCPCTDGGTAAAVAFMRLGSAATYIGLSTGDLVDAAALRAKFPDEAFRDKHVVVLDICLPGPLTERAIAAASSFLVLDHHRSSELAMSSIPDRHKVFEMRQSGASLAWNYFFPGLAVPRLVRYVEDRDLWRGAMHNTDQVSSAMQLQDVGSPDNGWLAKLLARGDAGVRDLALAGVVLRKRVEQVVAEHARHASRKHLRGWEQYTAAVVNCTLPEVSDVGNALCRLPLQRADFGATWSYNHARKLFKVSLRSISDVVGGRAVPRADVSAIAETFGGGGHVNAAGFLVDCTSIEELFVDVE